MRHHPLSTRGLQAARALNQSPDARWVDWAVRLLVEGADTPSLRMVAGLSPPFDSFDATRLVDRAFDELGVTALEPAEVPAAYAHDLVAELARGTTSMPDLLEELSQLCIETNYSRDLMPFYLLYYAHCDLVVEEYTHHWEGADRANFDRIVRDVAKRWLDKRAS